MNMMQVSTERIDAIYARQSIDKSESISIESQIDFCKYETKGRPYQVFSDKGYSGKNTERPGFQELLRSVRSGAIQRVICYRLDRCSRSILDFTELIQEFQKYDVEFVSCTEKFDTSTPIGRAMLNICIVFAQLERETIQQRVYDAYHARCRKGFFMGGRTPFGFRRVPYAIDGKTTACYEEIPEEAEILRFIYHQYQSPTVSLQDVVNVLHTEGISNPKRSDGIWCRSHISRILNNPIYVKADMRIFRYFQQQGATICNDPEAFNGRNGCYLYKDQNDDMCLVIAPHCGLVSSEIWLRCRNKHTTKTNKVQVSGEKSWLRGKLICGICGYRMAIRQTTKSNGKIYRYIRCMHGTTTEKERCNDISWKIEYIEELIESQMKKRIVEILQEGSVNHTGCYTSSNILEIKLAQLQHEIDNIASKALTAGDDMYPYLYSQMRILEKKKRTLIQRIKRTNTNCDRKTLLKRYDRPWRCLPAEVKVRIADKLIESIQLSQYTIRIIWKL